MRNPTWTEDELVLALDLYFRLGRHMGDINHPEIVQLSTTLNSLPIHPASARSETFRDPAGVSMKLGNIARLDEERGVAGLPRGSALNRMVWDKYHSNLALLRETADAIRRNGAALPASDTPRGDSPDYEASEGSILFRTHRYRERNRRLVELKKQRVQSQHLPLRCEVCGFDFELFYGSLGADFIECHHVLPLHQLVPGTPTRLDDLALVCSNCHSMLHRNNATLSIQELRAHIDQHNTRGTSSGQ